MEITPAAEWTPPVSSGLAGSRLAQRWLRGIAAREMVGEDEVATPSLLDLTSLCVTADEPSPTSIVLLQPLEYPEA